ncbi:MAG: ATPase [Magnetococcales bacterium]|nr:ATPase [Magnetococcales bacterium]
MFRPQSAHWFRLLVAREDLPQTLALLTTQQGIELDTQADHSPLLSDETAEYLAAFQQLARQFHAYWPATPLPDSAKKLPFPNNPQQVLEEALEALEKWHLEAAPVIQRLDEERAWRSDLILYEALARRLAAQPRSSSLELALLRTEGDWLTAALFVLPEPLESLPPQINPILYPVPGEGDHFLIAVGTKEDMRILAEGVATAKGRPLPIPHWSEGAAQTALPEIKQRVENSTEKLERLQQALAVIHRRHRIPHHLQAVAHLQWFFAAIERVQTGPWLVHVAGWTDEADEAKINQGLQQNQVCALLDLSATPPTAEPPIILANPWWVKPFELFARLLGIPGRHEVDPSPLLLLVAPLLFGYMFGDVGQGAVLALVGWLLRGQLAGSWLLITGGISASFFGLLFGSLFCREDLLPALWLHPTHHPLPVLAVPVLLGMLLLLTGLILDGISHYWRGQLRSWWLRESAILLLYVGLLLGILHPAGWMLAVAALGWFIVGNRLAGDAPLALLGHLAHLLETGMQLGVNTLSFARVGAFALAHAGLSQAVVTLADLPQNAFFGFLILLFGNLLILLLEGLVVSVQTTRLILFEFFVRFLRGEGRLFRPLKPPPGWLFQS